jgi:cysteinyl-tRNA synthetase
VIARDAHRKAVEIKKKDNNSINKKAFQFVMQMRLYDTLSGVKQEFVIDGNSVKVLLCGPTVYDYSHAGHARTLLFYDLIARYFRLRHIRVSIIVNITDIDPKIFLKARLLNTTSQQIADKFVHELFYDLSLLGIENFMFALVSDHVEVAQNLILQLIESGMAYPAGGNIYLDCSHLRSFGLLAKMTRQDLDDCRLDISQAKKSPSDILLWNASDEFEMMFDSKVLGTGIPWWHIQDSSVAMACYSGSYDIHGGASELEYPHHESHLAQLKALTLKEKPVRFWTHVGLVQLKGRKMSKSLGNTIAIRDLLRRYSPNALRLYLYSRHYRDNFNFSERDLDMYEHVNHKIMAALPQLKKFSKLEKIFLDHLEDDFDTPGALEIMIQAAKLRQLSNAMVTIFGLRY